MHTEAEVKVVAEVIVMLVLTAVPLNRTFDKKADALLLVKDKEAMLAVPA